jgi:hypothetical protein
MYEKGFLEEEKIESRVIENFHLIIHLSGTILQWARKFPFER